MEEYPRNLWYVAYIFLWFPAGIACYFVWKNKNKEEAKRQFWYSTWLGILVWFAILGVFETLLYPLGFVFG